jgi:hypothetical protein
MRWSSVTGAEPLMGHRSEEDKNARAMIWTRDGRFQGWICSRCEWNYPLPTLLSDPQAKTAYDRLAAGKFRAHACENYLGRLGAADPESFPARIRQLVKQGFKPRDAVEILLQEVMLEHRSEPTILEQARIDGEDFLRHVREGLA